MLSQTMMVLAVALFQFRDKVKELLKHPLHLKHTVFSCIRLLRFTITASKTIQRSGEFNVRLRSHFANVYMVIYLIKNSVKAN